MGLESLGIGALAGMLPAIGSGFSSTVGPLLGLGGEAAAGAAAPTLASFGKDLLGGALMGGAKSGLGLLADGRGSGASAVPQLPAPPQIDLPQFGSTGTTTMQAPLMPLQGPAQTGPDLFGGTTNSNSPLMPSRRTNFYTRLYG